jgi:hypothetical protein
LFLSLSLSLSLPLSLSNWRKLEIKENVALGIGDEEIMGTNVNPQPPLSFCWWTWTAI